MWCNKYDIYCIINPDNHIDENEEKYYILIKRVKDRCCNFPLLEKIFRT